MIRVGGEGFIRGKKAAGGQQQTSSTEEESLVYTGQLHFLWTTDKNHETIRNTVPGLIKIQTGPRGQKQLDEKAK